MDEIHGKSDFSYTGGRIIGSSITPNTPATTVLAFMVSSLCRKWSTFVHLLPCSKTSASQLFPITKQIIADIENDDVEFWRNTCSNCDTFGWEYLNTIPRITTNFILSNAVKNLNSLKLALTPRDDNRKIKKFKSPT